MNIAPLIETFSFRKIRNHLCIAFLSSSYFSGLTLFEIKAAVIHFKDFVFGLFPCQQGIFGTPKRAATPLWGVPFSNFLSALYFTLYDLFSARRIVATNSMTVKFQNVDKQCI